MADEGKVAARPEADEDAIMIRSNRMPGNNAAWIAEKSERVAYCLAQFSDLLRRDSTLSAALQQEAGEYFGEGAWLCGCCGNGAKDAVMTFLHVRLLTDDEDSQVIQEWLDQHPTDRERSRAIRGLVAGAIKLHPRLERVEAALARIEAQLHAAPRHTHAGVSQPLIVAGEVEGDAEATEVLHNLFDVNAFEKAG